MSITREIMWNATLAMVLIGACLGGVVVYGVARDRARIECITPQGLDLAPLHVLGSKRMFKPLRASKQGRG